MIPPSRAASAPAALVGGWLSLLVVGVVVGQAFARTRPIDVGAVPWVGTWGFDESLVGRLVVAAAVLGAAVWVAPVFARDQRWRLVLVGAAIVTVALTFLLAWAGPDDTHWPGIRFGYAAHTHLVDDWGGPADFLRSYVERQPGLTAHLRAHPPGLLLGLWAFERIGLAGLDFHLALMLVAGAVSTLAALVALRSLAGEAAARAAVPFVAIGPVLVWRTNTDVVFGAIAVGAVALFVLATGIASRRANIVAATAGVVFGVALFCTYGVALLGLPMLVVAVHRHRLPLLVIAALGAVTVVLLPAVWGFSWVAGLLETRRQYYDSIARLRGYKYWLLGNAAIFAALIGPAVVVGLTRVRGATRRLAFAGLACVVLAGLSGLSSAETERIWQPFVPLVLVAGGALWLRSGAVAHFDVAAARRWLGLQAVVAIAFQSVLWTRV